MSLEALIEEFLLERGALKVGIATLETLEGSPPSGDIIYRMAEARSAISFALPLDRDKIRAFLSKEDRFGHEEDNIRTNLRSKDLSWELASMLQGEGHKAKGNAANLKYRQEVGDWELTLPPDISHRYIAARSGAGSFGWSGNIGIEGFGTAIILGTTLTDADLTPSDPVPESDSFCNKCKACFSACAVKMFDKVKTVSVRLGGVDFTHSARKEYLYCDFCCGGFTGLSQSGKWSTWSPGRFRLPDNREELLKEFYRAVDLYNKWPRIPGGFLHPALDNYTQHLTCGNCQIVCWGDKRETAQNLKLLRESGCVLQRPDGSLYALPTDEAQSVFEAMPSEEQALYG
jgi:epoxyqueuosine reductase